MKPFWETKTLSQMTHEEWESLCDGCGRCCLVVLEDEEEEGAFYEICREAEAMQLRGEDLSPLDFKYFFYPWWRELGYRLDQVIRRLRTSNGGAAHAAGTVPAGRMLD